MFLIDTNIWLEIILEQEKAEEARNFLQSINSSSIFITDFSVCSIGIHLLRGKKHDVFVGFINDAFVKVGIGLIRLEPIEMREISSISLGYNLDFDDAYQYFVAEKYDLTIVSFDGDFDRTHRGRKTPQEILVE
jgi:uncharacterized protein